MLKLWLCLPMVFCLLTSAGFAHAEGFALYEYSARGVAISGAVMARKPDPSAVSYNPALLTRLPGTHAMDGVTTVYPRGKIVREDKSPETPPQAFALAHPARLFHPPDQRRLVFRHRGVHPLRSRLRVPA